MPSNNSLKKNVVANYTSQIYSTLVSILFFPLYLKYLGAESYGLIGFFAMLLVWFALLDFGLSPLISRETTRYKSGALKQSEYYSLLKSLAFVFFIIGLIGYLSIYFLSAFISRDWFELELLSTEVVSNSIQIMGGVVVFRWLSGFLRGILIGNEKFVSLALINITFNSLRFIGVFGSFWLFDFKIEVFFFHQLVVGFLELICLALCNRKLIPNKPKNATFLKVDFRPLKLRLGFSLSVAFTSSVWVFVTQTDKLILSGMLELSEYGYFSLAVMVANAIIILNSPITAAILPRLTSHHAKGLNAELTKLYAQTTKVTALISGTAALTLAVFPDEILFVWTGDQEVVKNTSDIMSIYAVGNFFLIFSSFASLLQTAIGNLKLHLIGSGLLLTIGVPSILISAVYFGAVGAAWAWLLVNFFYLTGYVTFTHYRLLKKIAYSWIFRVIVYSVVPILVLVTSSMLFNNIESRLYNFLLISISALAALLFNFVFLKKVDRLIQD